MWNASLDTLGVTRGKLKKVTPKLVRVRLEVDDGLVNLDTFGVRVGGTTTDWLLNGNSGNFPTRPVRQAYVKDEETRLEGRGGPDLLHSARGVTGFRPFPLLQPVPFLPIPSTGP